MDADLVVLGADPAHDVTAFSNVRYVIRSGKVMTARYWNALLFCMTALLGRVGTCGVVGAGRPEPSALTRGRIG